MAGGGSQSNPSSPGRNEYVAEILPLYIFPRESNNLFGRESEVDSYFNGRKARQVELKNIIDFFYFSDTSALPEISNLNGSGSNKFKERELVIFDGDNSKIFTVCILENIGNRYFWHKKLCSNDSISQAELVIDLINNYTQRTISLSYSCASLPTSDPFDTAAFGESINFCHGKELKMMHIKITVGGIINNGSSSQLPKKENFSLRARLFSADGFLLARSPAPLPVTFSTYKGWTLTKDGELQQGRNGYLYDENDYCILTDGRRVTETVWENLGSEQAPKIGRDNTQTAIGVREGLYDILKGESNPDFIINRLRGFNVRFIKNTYTIYEDLLKDNYNEMKNLVVFQAFQIAACYPTSGDLYPRHFPLGRNAEFYSIGTDETDIPIVVTRVGDNTAPKKLVIAGPHGDERNAQRLIMAAQKRFVKGETQPASDTTMYFIPCLSPTMAFADARGIPVVEITNNVAVRRLSINEALSRTKLTIPYLHDLIATRITTTNQVSAYTGLLRSLIQGTKDDKGIDLLQNGVAFDTYAQYAANTIKADYPRYGIDANRDVGQWLPSTTCFIGFMRAFIDNRINPGDIKVIMVHGYEGSGAVYGTYRVTPALVAEMVPEGKIFADTFRKFLYGDINFTDLYTSTGSAPLVYAGEWSQILYRRFNILSVDVELPSGAYNEGYRGEGGDRAYVSSTVKNDDFNGGVLVRGSFYELLRLYSDIIANGGTVG
jgi:hypothetical protein